MPGLAFKEFTVGYFTYLGTCDLCLKQLPGPRDPNRLHGEVATCFNSSSRASSQAVFETFRCLLHDCVDLYQLRHIQLCQRRGTISHIIRVLSRLLLSTKAQTIHNLVLRENLRLKNVCDFLWTSAIFTCNFGID